MSKCPQCLNVLLDDADVCPKCGTKVASEKAQYLAREGIDDSAVTKIFLDTSMTPEKWQQIKEVFESARELTPENRKRYLQNACPENSDTRKEVELLLESFDKEDDFLEDSAVAEVASLIEGEDGETFDSEEDSRRARFKKGTVIDTRYEIIDMLGKGGMGEVFLAKDRKLDRRVALKVLPADLTESKARLHRFQQEARAVSALNHPHILTIYEFGETIDGIHFIASEYVEGKTLAEHGSFDDLTLSRVLDIAIQVASALAAAHEAGITHRDIKPDNIMVRGDGYIKVLDFGLAKLSETAVTGDVGSEATTRAQVDTAPGAVMGTAAYMSPEQARGLPVDARTDIWSLGVVIYELITGRQPFRGETSTDTIISVIKKEPKPINNYVPDFPSEIEWVVSKTLSKEKDGRYQTAKELNADLVKIKKRVDFAVESSRSGDSPGYQSEDPIKPRTIMLERGQTEIKGGQTTNQVTAGVVDASQTESSLEYAVVTASRHKGLTAVFGLIMASAFAVIAYFAIGLFVDSGKIDSIAVLPFENGSEAKGMSYLSDGISESLLDRLSELPQLRVIARNSSFKFRDKNPDIKDVANQLGVKAVVTGRVVQDGDNLTIRVDVVGAEQNNQIFGQTFNRKVDDLLQIQNEIARAISEKLELKLTGDQQNRLTTSGTNNSEAYRYYLNGLVSLRGPNDIRGDAINQFRKAVELDPEFALAHAEISRIYSGLAAGTGNPGQLMPKAKAAAKRAIEIDDKLANGHAALALVYEFEFDWMAAEQEYKRAIELNPNLDLARTGYAFYLSIMNRNTESLDQVRQAQLRDPASVRMILLWKAIILVQAREFDNAIKLYDETKQLDEGGSAIDFDYGYVFLGKEEYEKAAASLEKSVAAFGGKKKYSQPLVYLAATYAKMPERRSEAIEILKTLQSSNEYVSPALIAIIYTSLGENDKAIKALEKAYSERDLLLRYISVGFEYDGLRKDPRFVDLLKRTGLPNTGL